jgi:hypothetical protein
MTLIDFVTELRNTLCVDSPLASIGDGIDIDAVDVYLKDSLDLDAEVRLFDAELIPNQLQILVDGTSYINLLPLYMIREFVCDPSLQEAESFDIAQRLIKYRIDDA